MSPRRTLILSAELPTGLEKGGSRQRDPRRERPPLRSVGIDSGLPVNEMHGPGGLVYSVSDSVDVCPKSTRRGGVEANNFSPHREFSNLLALAKN